MIFFPPEKMNEAFKVVKEEMPEYEDDEDLNKKIQDFTEYFKSTYVGSEEQELRFPGKTSQSSARF